ncbi:hypothetical protein FGO68_gene3797 [Halteria grandinella]|uniref:Uncharacterized protein n=1 Tax=Halteria grandinella TaxID=5974 RepID=A0A8J8NL46_HALGN|nr:hypothetical protein FGO68_gene3797 [Halteria grandinella]
MTLALSASTESQVTMDSIAIALKVTKIYQAPPIDVLIISLIKNLIVQKVQTAYLYTQVRQQYLNYNKSLKLSHSQGHYAQLLQL